MHSTSQSAPERRHATPVEPSTDRAQRFSDRFWTIGPGYVVHTRDGDWLRGELVRKPGPQQGLCMRLEDGSERRVAADAYRFVFRPDDRALDPALRDSMFDVGLRDGSGLRGQLHALSVGEDGVSVLGRIGDLEGRFMLAPDMVDTLQLSLPSPRVDAPAAAQPVAIDASSRVHLLADTEQLGRYLDAQVKPGAHLAADAFNALDLDGWLEHAGDDDEVRLRFAQAQRFGLPLVDLRSTDASETATKVITPALARRLRVLPLALRDSAVAVAVLDPADAELSTTLEFLTGRRVVPVLALRQPLEARISEHYDRAEDDSILRSLGLQGNDIDDASRADIEQLADQQPIVRLVSGLIAEAIRRRASDIHLRPHEHDVSVLLRIDGLLQPVRRLAKPLLRAVVSRIKVLAGMDVAEHRLPQDGRATVIEGDDVVDLRISVLPTVDGESVVIRLLNTRQGLRNLDELGLLEHDERLLRDMFARSHGLVLVTGPTGSGKSTTLYAALLDVRRRNVNIITVEDPVEYHVSDIEQVQVNESIGYDFNRTLRNILRHDPDVIMIGEIRDRETAEIAVESALTGHIVLSTLHTNSAATTVTRMLDLGVESFLLRSTLMAVLAQRLARRNCRHCLVEESVDPFIRESLGVAPEERFYKGAGCSRCDGTGVHGRQAVYELMPISAGVRHLIEPNADADAIHEQAVGEGMTPLTARALQLAREGVLSLAEVYRIRVE
jgi:type IV pilus assembly protein PilB